MPRRAFFRISFFCFTLVVFLYVCCIGIKNVFRYNTYKSAHVLKENELEAVRQKNTQLKQDLLDMESEHYWELQVKERLGWVKSGEVEYRILSQ